MERRTRYSRGGFRGGGASGAIPGADLGGGGFGGSSPPLPNLEWAGLQCAHAQRHVITIDNFSILTKVCNYLN